MTEESKEISAKVSLISFLRSSKGVSMLVEHMSVSTSQKETRLTPRTWIQFLPSAVKLRASCYSDYLGNLGWRLVVGDSSGHRDWEH